MNKTGALQALVRKRRAARWSGYHRIGDFHGGVYECDYVSPYTRGASNLDAEIFILLQDWASADRLQGPIDEDAASLGRTPSLPTNRNLARLLSDYFGVALSDTYATNLLPFVKPGGLSARIPAADLVRAAREFAIPQIGIIQPRLVICMGLATFRAIQRAADRPRARNLDDAIESPFSLEGAPIWCQAHTGALGQANRNRGGSDRVSRDWDRMRRAFVSPTCRDVGADMLSSRRELA